MENDAKELAQIVQRNYSWLVSMAGLDAGLTDYSLRHDLFRMIALANAVHPEGWVGPERDERDKT